MGCGFDPSMINEPFSIICREVLTSWSHASSFPSGYIVSQRAIIAALKDHSDHMPSRPDGERSGAEEEGEEEEEADEEERQDVQHHTERRPPRGSIGGIVGSSSSSTLALVSIVAAKPLLPGS